MKISPNLGGPLLVLLIAGTIGPSEGQNSLRGVFQDVFQVDEPPIGAASAANASSSSSSRNANDGSPEDQEQEGKNFLRGFFDGLFDGEEEAPLEEEENEHGLYSLEELEAMNETTLQTLVEEHELEVSERRGGFLCRLCVVCFAPRHCRRMHCDDDGEEPSSPPSLVPTRVPTTVAPSPSPSRTPRTPSPTTPSPVTSSPVPGPTSDDDTVIEVKAIYSSTTDSNRRSLAQITGSELIDAAKAIASLMGGTLVSGSISSGLFGTRPVVDFEFQVFFGDDVTIDIETFQGDETLRNALVVSLSLDESTVLLSTCASQCGEAEEDVPSGYCYPPTNECVCTGRYGGSSCDSYCYAISSDATCDNTSGCSWCDTTGTCLVSSSVARLPEEIQSCPESCSAFTNQERFCNAATSCNYCASNGSCTNVDEANAAECPFAVKTTSPRNGEENVALTRETVIEFTEPVNPDTVITSNIQVVAAQIGTLDTDLHLSSTGLTLTIFYEEDLPANTDVAVRINHGLKSTAGSSLDTLYEVYFSTLSVLPVAGTMVCGRVFASEQSEDDDGVWLDVPLEGVTISVDGNSAINTVTEADGTFVSKSLFERRA